MNSDSDTVSKELRSSEYEEIKQNNKNRNSSNEYRNKLT